ncbi:MAG: type II toxin-antitoxin system VapC family toxin [Chloroflexi bacterium]|nr:type II toxin-antitoxin system VapC family toxin [Chloroflexota bacterium]
MRLLLDTHTFLWWDSEPEKLSSRSLELLQNRNNILFLSVVSAWEIQIKLQLGKIKIGLPLADIIESQQQANNIEIIPVKLEHVLRLSEIPSHHKDPFDRLLIVQAIAENLTLVSKDPAFSNYPVKVNW